MSKQGSAAVSSVQTGRGDRLQDELFNVRRQSEELAKPLTPEDQVVQSMADVSPTKWHLGHTTWFFETFVLVPHLEGYQVFDERFPYCFNSYYEHAGKRQPRARRGLMTRPTSGEVTAYRAHVDNGLRRMFAGRALNGDLIALIELGINHEQQHQELLLMDILNVFWSSPLRPTYQARQRDSRETAPSPLTWSEFAGGTFPVGHEGPGFSFDNEGPRHDALVRPFAIANRLVTNGEWLEFMSEGGYRDFRHWLSDGWAKVQADDWEAPDYWEAIDGVWHQMTLEGFSPVDPGAPVCNVSYYEADAFARWAGMRLPTEFEWEIAARRQPEHIHSTDRLGLRPGAAGQSDTGLPAQMFGAVWQWTQSSYAPYPGFKAATGAVGEYNGKFMVSQYVLRGSACITPPRHSRVTYRNFFYPHQRWQFAGLRLATDR